MVITTSPRWLDEGLNFLARVGVNALRIDDLARALGVTKGSFYHHFVDLADYRRALLAHFEERCTTRYIHANAQLEMLAPVDRLLALADAVLAEEHVLPGLELRVRSWANQDDDAHDTVARVDARRVAYLDGLASAILGEPERAADLAATIYYLLIGSQHTVPPAPPGQLRRLWEQALDAAIASQVPR